jgi:hypothetical protein
VDGAVVRVWYLAVCVLLTACSGEIVQNWTTEPASDLSEPNYRRIVADNIRTMFPEQTKLGEMEISGVRRVEHFKGTAWITCLRLDAHGNPQSYAVFIQADKIIDSRVGIIMDQCHKETFTPFELPAAAAKPATTAKPATAAKKP